MSIAKATNRWRTLLVLQELEGEVAGVAGSHETRRELKVLLSRKDRLADVLNHLRTVLRRIETRGPPESLSPEEATQRSHHHDLMQRILAKLMDLDVQIETRLTNYGATVNRLVSHSLTHSLTHSLSWSLKSLQTQTATQPSHFACCWCPHLSRPPIYLLIGLPRPRPRLIPVIHRPPAGTGAL